MSALASGLPEIVADEELLARMLTSSGWVAVSNGRIKHPAFLPAPDHETSVFRSDTLTDSRLMELGRLAAGERGLHGAAVVQCRVCRHASLDAQAKEPPPFHANLVGWPVLEGDPDLQKARRKEIAMELAAGASWKRFD